MRCRVKLWAGVMLVGALLGPGMSGGGVLAMEAAGRVSGAGAAREGWRALFDRRDLAGWEHVGPGGFVVRDGLLVAEGGMGLLVWTGGPVGRCELRIVYRSRGRNENSGVFVRVPERPTEPWMPVRKGYEVQIDNEDDVWHRTGTLYSFTRAMASPGRAGPAWNTMVIRLDGRRTMVTVNGVLVTDFTEVAGWVPPPRVHDYEPYAGTRPDAGWIGLQNHGAVEFREVAMRGLAAGSRF